MITFPIEFEYDGVKHTALVEKTIATEVLTTEYNVHDLKPNLLDLSDPYKFIRQPGSEVFLSELNPNYGEFPEKLWETIVQECEIRNISLVNESV